MDISVCLFGSFPIRINGRPQCLAISRVTLDLLRYMIIYAGRELRRERLADIFWSHSTQDRQRSAFNSAIWRIKKQLKSLPGIELRTMANAVSLTIADNISVDARELKDAVQIASSDCDMGSEVALRLSTALEETDAPFLDGLVEDWALADREQLFNLRIRGLTILMRWYGELKQYEYALETGRKLLVADPFREAAQCETMWLYVLNSQRAQALRQYENFAELLAAELDIEPMAETRALYDHIRRGLNCNARTPDRLSPVGGNAPAQQRHLGTLFAAIERSRRDLYHALRDQLG